VLPEQHVRDVPIGRGERCLDVDVAVAHELVGVEHDIPVARRGDLRGELEHERALLDLVASPARARPVHGHAHAALVCGVDDRQMLVGR
jgi:hypothetical protein